MPVIYAETPKKVISTHDLHRNPVAKLVYLATRLSPLSGLDANDVFSLRAFLALGNGKLNTLTFC